MIATKVTFAIVVLVVICEACIPDQKKVEEMGEHLRAHAKQKLCSPPNGVKPGTCPPKGKKELNWLLAKTINYWEKELKRLCKGKGLPQPWKKDAMKIYDKCHKGANYCIGDNQEKAKKCATDMAMGLLMSYMPKLGDYCPCALTIIDEFKSKHEPVVKGWINQYAAAKKGMGC